MQCGKPHHSPQQQNQKNLLPVDLLLPGEVSPWPHQVLVSGLFSLDHLQEVEVNLISVSIQILTIQLFYGKG